MPAALYDAERLAGLELRWGKGLMSPGGAEALSALLDGTDLSGLSGLDFGCGLGGYTAMLVARHGAANVIGVDIDIDLILEARRRIVGNEIASRTTFRAVAPGPLPFEACRFDFILSKEVLVRIGERPSVLAELHRVLRPGGRLYLSDWYCCEGPPSPEMRRWQGNESYAMETIDQAAAALRAARFDVVAIEDRNEWFRRFAEEECRRLEDDDAALCKFAPRKARSLLRAARLRAQLAAQGQLRPGHIRAVKAG